VGTINDAAQNVQLFKGNSKHIKHLQKKSDLTTQSPSSRQPASGMNAVKKKRQRFPRPVHASPNMNMLPSIAQSKAVEY